MYHGDKNILLERLLKHSIEPIVFSNNFNKYINTLFNSVIEGNHFAKATFTKEKINISKYNVNDINNINSYLNSQYFPNIIKDSILNNSKFIIKYNFSVKNRNIEIQFIIPHYNAIEFDNYCFYIQLIMNWIHVANKYACKKCACGKNLTIYLFFTDYKKKLNVNKNVILDAININTGVSDICSNNSNIIIYRKEEWFKVLIHEIFHNYNLDFAKADTSHVKDIFKKYFFIKSDFNIYEIYCESMARLINTLYVGIYSLNYDNYNTFYYQFKMMFTYEIIFSIMQANKILHYMDLNYKGIIMQDTSSLNNYNENTNVFCYYIGVALIFININKYINFIYSNNYNILRFNHKNINNYIKFIINNYKTKYTIKEFMDKHLEINDNLRMSIFDFYLR